MVTWEDRRSTGRYASVGGKLESVDTGVIHCDSTDEKPVERIGNGTWLLENDTGKVYAFSESLAKWFEWGG